MTESSDPKPQSLWNVMKRAGLTTSTAQTVVRNSEDDPSPTAAPKGLWKVMGLAAAPRPADTEISQPAAVTDDERSPDVESPARRRHSDASSRGLASFSQMPPVSDDVEAEFEPASAAGLSPKKFVPEPRTKFDALKRQSHQAAVRNGWMTLAVGLAGFVTSSLSYLESFWFRLPATGLGLIALVMGLMALSATARRQEEKQIKTIAGIGMACGLLGMFMGPLVFSGWGARARQEAAIADSRFHLEDIGYALDRHHAAKGRFPAGGSFVKQPNGREQGMHGWMTELLPYVDKADLYSMIDFDKPYDDPANFAPFSQDVPTFFASGGNHAKIGRGFAVAHFAGVGGTVKDQKGRAIDLGVFGPNSDVRRTHITDGTSNTLIVGEVGYGYPAWGEPENWRQVGKGLNREAVGFGNAQDTGAIFLFADGSVKFFANNTDPRVLEQLSTRNGEDNAGK
ncbi:MAG: DUF1559 domain-containing protein [Planctomycetaceae bacterium]